MGLSWQQGPLSPGAIGRFLVPEPLPKRLLYAEPLRRRMRVRFGGKWIADSEHVLLLFEPGRYPIAYFPETDVSSDTLQRTEYATRHPDLGPTCWYAVRAGDKSAPRGRGSTSSCPPTRASYEGGSRSPGRPWMLLRRRRTDRGPCRRQLPPHRHPPSFTQPRGSSS